MILLNKRSDQKIIQRLGGVLQQQLINVELFREFELVMATRGASLPANWMEKKEVDVIS